MKNTKELQEITFYYTGSMHYTGETNCSERDDYRHLIF